MTKIAPSLLSANFAHLGREVEEIEKARGDYLHIDVMDGHFVPNITMGPFIVESIKNITTIPLDVHLMIDQPDRYLKPFQLAGCHFISVHVEACPHLHRTITEIKNLGCLAGVAINPATSIDAIDEILEYLDRVIVMSVNPGFGGQSFIKSSLNKIEKLAEIKSKRNFSFEIEVDGGVNHLNAKRLAQTGAEVLVVGSEIFNNRDSIQNNMERIRSATL